jgi:transcription elongation factor GreA
VVLGNIMANQAVYVTEEGLKKIEEELEHLCTVRRKEVAQRLHEAMEDGELIENAEYEAAKNEQAFVEGRILELEHILAQARVIKRGDSKDIVAIGSTVEVREKGARKTETFTIVGAAEANPKEGLISNQSPYGMALLSHKVGDEVEVQAPAGVIRLKIVKIE